MKTNFFSLHFLDVFKLDNEYTTNEEKYAALRKEILDESEGDDESGEEGDEDDDEEDEEEKEKNDAILDKTETNLVSNIPWKILLTLLMTLNYSCD